MYGPNITKMVKMVCRECNQCKALRSIPYGYPTPPELPPERFKTQQTPFTITAVDYSGPHKVIVGKTTQKVYICLFTCVVCRAVHLEIAPDLSTKAFLDALKNLMFKYGPPKLLISDNATNFAAGNRILQEIKNRSTTQDALRQGRVV